MAKRALANHLFATSIVALLLLNGGVIAQTQQQDVHDMSHGVMPFDVAKTVHIFRMTESGGIERVVVKDKNDADQVLFIRQHLRNEAGRFQRGDYSDPAMLHGANMPGLKELQLGAKGVKVSYSELADGAEIAFKTTNLHLLTAIHRWFGAQLSFAPAARSPRRRALSTRDTLPPQVPPFVATDRTICSDCVSWPSQLAMAVTVDARLPLMTATRRLTAIMAADVAGYSRLMGADEEVRLAGDPHQ